MIVTRPHVPFDRFAVRYDQLQTLSPDHFGDWLGTLQLHQTRALDFGCGSGRHTSILAESTTRVVAIDCSPAMIELARKNCKHANIDFQLGGAEQIRGTFDLIVSVECAHHFESLSQFIAHLKDALNPGGTIIVADIVDVPRWTLASLACAAGRHVLRRGAWRHLDGWRRLRHELDPGWVQHRLHDRYYSSDHFDEVVKRVLPECALSTIKHLRVCRWRQEGMGPGLGSPD